MSILSTYELDGDSLAFKSRSQAAECTFKDAAESSAQRFGFFFVFLAPLLVDWPKGITHPTDPAEMRPLLQ